MTDKKENKKTLLCFGYGASAQVLAQRLLPLGWRIIGTTRDAKKIKNETRAGVELHLWQDTDLSPFIAQASHLLCSIAPNEHGDAVLLKYSETLKQKQFNWVGYLSTTAVYGDHGGAWVDETTPTKPTSPRGPSGRGHWRVAAENAWQELNIGVHIFRLAGIYGRGRGPFKKLQDGTARRIIKDGQVFSRIHLDDIAQVLAASIARPNPTTPAIYNLCDDCPAPPQEVIAYAAKLLGLPAPEAIAFETAKLSPMARSFYLENKRVRNDKIKTELGITLLYPDYKAGLKAMLNETQKLNQ